MVVIGLDPAPDKTAFVLYDSDSSRLLDFFIEYNDVVRGTLRHLLSAPRTYTLHVAIEMVACYGMAVGASVFDTAAQVGRFEECVLSSPLSAHVVVERVFRKDVKMHICGRASAKDPNIRQALIDRFGGEQETKKGGRLYKVSKDVWAALAVACTYADAHSGLIESTERELREMIGRNLYADPTTPCDTYGPIHMAEPIKPNIEGILAWGNTA